MRQTATAYELMKPAEVAQRLHVSRSTVYRLVYSGVLPAVKVGGSLRFDPNEIDDYIYGDQKENE